MDSRFDSKSAIGLALSLLVSMPCLSLWPSEAGASTLFFDDFRGSESLDGRTWDTQGAKQPVLIDAERACADTQTGAWYNRDVTSPHVRVSYNFSAGSVEGLESYVVAGTGSQVFLAGCDGGFGESTCTPLIRRVLKGAGDTVGPSTSSPGIRLQPDAIYRIEADFNDGLITLQVRDSDGQILGGTALSLAETFLQFGFGVGRGADGKLSCIDDFRIEALD